METKLDWNRLEDDLIALGENCDPYKVEQLVYNFYEQNINVFKHFHSALWISDLQDRYHGFDLWNGLLGKEFLYHYHLTGGWNDLAEWKNSNMQTLNSSEDRKALLKLLKSLVGE